jgi:hypothetical protein
MTNPAKIMPLVEKLGGDTAQRESASKELYEMGPAVIKPLYMMHFSQEGEAHTEIHRILASIGDDLFAAGGPEEIEQEILKAMKSGAKKSRQWAAEEVYTLSVDALNRWGVAVPAVTDQAIHVCHVCGKNITEERVMVCGLHSCDNAVCREHSHIIETRFGKFDGSGGAWFCTNEHYNHANHHHIDWN